MRTLVRAVIIGLIASGMASTAGLLLPERKSGTANAETIVLAPGDSITIRAAECDEVPPDPDPDPDPDPGDACYGFRETSGFWRGWCVDSDRNYTDRDGHGAMGSNAQGERSIGVDDDGEGRIRFRVLLTHSSQINLAGGKHLGGISSRPVGRLGPDAARDATRIDLDRPSSGKIRAHLYNYENGVLFEEVWWANISGLELGRWAQIEMKWQRIGGQLKATINSQEHFFNLRPGSPNPGRYFYLGNMDNITGLIEFDDLFFEQ